MKPKQNYKDTAVDRCQTPSYAIAPLLPYMNKDWVIWESAEGKGNITKILFSCGIHVIGSDILSGFDFFNYEPGVSLWDCQITNPPYSIKYDWLKRSFELNKPFALLLPLETLGAAKGQKLFKKYGIEIVLLNRRVHFDMPKIGFSGHGPQFPVAWFTWKWNIGQQINYGYIDRTEFA